MKSSIKGLFVILAIVISLVAVQGVCAVETYTVEGTFVSISDKPNKIVLLDDEEETFEVYGVSSYKLEKYNIYLEEGDYVMVEVYDYICSNGTPKLKAVSITVGALTVELRAVP